MFKGFLSRRISYFLMILFIILNSILIYFDIFYLLALPFVILLGYLFVFRLDLIFLTIVFCTPLSFNFENLDFLGIGFYFPTEPMLFVFTLIFLFKALYEKNLKKEALKNGVDGDRLIFAEHLKLEEHLNRFKFVDLFLDTFPYNAHTTCSDALRMNVPVLTKKGLSFASRVASSLLSTINLTELITTNNNDYEELAIKIANDPYYSKELKIKIEKNKEVSSLFKTELFTTNLESGYKKVYNNFINGLKPSNIDL